MPAYLPYPTKKDTPSRMTRKQSRRKIFVTNAGLAAQKRKQKKAAKRAAEEALEAEEGTGE